MDDNLKRDAFDKLVAGLSKQDRMDMLNSINQNLSPAVTFDDNEIKENDSSFSLHAKYTQESFFYRIILWFRSIFYKKTTEILYNEDLIAALARRVNKNHSGLVNHKNKLLDSIFFQQLKSLKESADFFKPYFMIVDENPGDFYVFLSSFINPELTEKINANADPFSLDFEVEPNIEIKKKLLKKLDELLEEMGKSDKTSLYEAITALNWLKEFSYLPFIHFTSQFTNLTDNLYTCPYKNAQIDYDKFAAVLMNSHEITNELLESLFLFSQRKDLSKKVKSEDIQEAVKQFIRTANQNLAKIQVFLSAIPVIKIGKIINENYDWTPGNTGGVEGWFPVFRSQWRKIIDLRWADWVRERKKNLISVSMQKDFGLEEFPVMKERPWLLFWDRTPFSCELTGGFLSWFVEEKFAEYETILTDVITEGIFERSQNKTEFSDGYNLFCDACRDMMSLLERLSEKGEIGTIFVSIKKNHIHSFQSQNQVEALLTTIENEIHDITKNFIKGSRILDAVMHGFFDSENDSIHFSLQNFNNIKGSQNMNWREKLANVRKGLNKCIFYLLELEPIDEAAVNDR